MDVGIGRVKKFSHRNDCTRPSDNNFYTCPVLLCVLFSNARDTRVSFANGDD